MDFPSVDSQGWQNCPGGEEAIRKEIAAIKGGDFILECQRSALHEGTKYWIWLYRNVSENPAWHWYVYVATTPDGKNHAAQTLDAFRGEYEAGGTRGQTCF